MAQDINPTTIKDLVQLNLPTFGDDRGFFREVLRITDLEKVTGIEFKTKQVNHARSEKNTLRGIHIAPWNKIVYVTSGEVQAVIVDCRKDSATYGKYQSFRLNEDNKSALFVPAYCGNSYLVLSPVVDYIYLTDQLWKPGLETSIAWNDPYLNIQWLLDGVDPILSEKDKYNPHFKVRE